MEAHAIQEIETPPRVKEFNRFIRVFFSRRLVLFGLIVIIIAALVAIFAPFIAPYDPYKVDMNRPLLQPCKEHLLGTDSLGRDTLTRIMYGARTSLSVGIIAVGIAAVIGMTLGLIAGYFGGMINIIIMRIIDTIMSFPMIILALVIAALLGGGLTNLLLALGISMMPAYARLMCGQVLSIKEHDYITASRTIGCSNFQIMVKHMLPNCFPPLIVLITMMIGMSILAEASLSFLGVGIMPPEAAWGAMVNAGYHYLISNPILSFAPGVAIMFTVFAFNMVGDGLRDALDPRLRGTL